MESFPLATSDLVSAGLFPSLSVEAREDLLAADRTLRDLRDELAGRSDTAWDTAGVQMNTFPRGAVMVDLFAPVGSDEVSFLLGLQRAAEGGWEIAAEVWLQSIAPVDSGQDLAADIVTQTAATPGAAAAAFAAAATELARAALSRPAVPGAWRC